MAPSCNGVADDEQQATLIMRARRRSLRVGHQPSAIPREFRTGQIAEQDFADSDFPQSPFQITHVRWAEHDHRRNSRRCDELAQPLQAFRQIVRQVEDQNISDRQEGEGREFSQRAAATHTDRFVSELALQLRLPTRP